jgi:hypothetical protein
MFLKFRVYEKASYNGDVGVKCVYYYLYDMCFYDFQY